MPRRLIAEAYSEQVDSLLAGQTPPGSDPLLSLASELATLAALDPSPEFAQRLRRELLLSWPRKRAAQSRNLWSLAAVAATLLLALALVLFWNPRTPSAAQVLARAADAVAVAPDQIELIVLDVEVSEEVRAGHTAGIAHYIIESWYRVDVSPDGRLTIAEAACTGYDADDAELSHALYQVYYRPSSVFCYLGLDTAFPSVPDLEECLTLEAFSTDDPGPAARYETESLREWIERVQANAEEIEFREDRFNAHAVYCLTYLEESPSVTVSSDVPFGPWVVEPVLSTMDAVTLYIDRQTYLPIGRIRRFATQDHTIIQTETIRHYQVVDPGDLEFDPFVWPPEQ